MSLKVAEVGFGRSGVLHHCKPLYSMQEYEVYAICDITEARLNLAKEMFPEVETYSDYNRILEDPAIDLVVISTPPHDHAEKAIQALNAGKNVVVDKPMCLTVEEADHMIESAEKNGVLLSVLMNRRWDEDYLTVKKIIEDGLLGEVFVIESRTPYYGFIPHAEKYRNWRLERSSGGGLLYDWGPHLIDQIIQMAKDKVKDIYCEMLGKIWYKEVDDYFKCIIRFQGGLIAQIESTLDSRIYLPRWYAIGTKGTLYGEYSPGAISERIVVKAELNGVETEITPQQTQMTFEEKSQKYYKNIYQTLVEGEELAIKPEEGREVIKVIEAAIKSSETKEVVKFNSKS